MSIKKDNIAKEIHEKEMAIKDAYIDLLKFRNLHQENHLKSLSSSQSESSDFRFRDLQYLNLSLKIQSLF